MVKLNEEGASAGLPGYTFRYYDDLKGRGWQYLNVFPSEKALKRERDKLHETTNYRQCYKPIQDLVEDLNRHLKGWANYFSFGYPREAFREINSYVRYRLEQHLKTAQPAALPPAGRSQL